MVDRRNFKTLSDMLLSWVTVTSLILGGVWAILEYRDRQRSAITDQVSQVLVFVERYNSDPIQKYREKKVKAFAEAYRNLWQVQNKREPEDPLKFQLDTVDEAELRFDIDNFTFFYDELFVCVKVGICDPETAHSFFGKHAYDFWRGLETYIRFVEKKRAQRGVDGYAEGLVYFEDAYREKKRKQ